MYLGGEDMKSATWLKTWRKRCEQSTAEMCLSCRSQRRRWEDALHRAFNAKLDRLWAQTLQINFKAPWKPAQTWSVRRDWRVIGNVNTDAQEGCWGCAAKGPHFMQIMLTIIWKTYEHILLNYNSVWIHFWKLVGNCWKENPAQNCRDPLRRRWIIHSIWDTVSRTC